MEQTERIGQMELRLEVAMQAVRRLTEALDEYEAASEALRELEAYYGSKEWKRDYADSEGDRLPEGLKCGVLGEDTLWNLLDERDEVRRRMQAL